jgi:hypothetical protein
VTPCGRLRICLAGDAPIRAVLISATHSHRAAALSMSDSAARADCRSAVAEFGWGGSRTKSPDTRLAFRMMKPPITSMDTNTPAPEMPEETAEQRERRLG